jgi:hypothetical protein
LVAQLAVPAEITGSELFQRLVLFNGEQFSRKMMKIAHQKRHKLASITNTRHVKQIKL